MCISDLSATKTAAKVDSTGADEDEAGASPTSHGKVSMTDGLVTRLVWVLEGHEIAF